MPQSRAILMQEVAGDYSVKRDKWTYTGSKVRPAVDIFALVYN